MPRGSTGFRRRLVAPCPLLIHALLSNSVHPMLSITSTSSSRTLSNQKYEIILPSPLPRPTAMSTSSSSRQSPLRMNTNTTASRFLTTMRQSFSPPPKKRQIDISKSGMYSTPEERTPHTSHFRSPDSSSMPPTIEQIAMGLHVSRTPHLRPISRPNYRRNSVPGSPSAYHLYETSRRVASPRPPSLKKTSPLGSTSTITPTMPGLSSTSISSTTVTSVTPSTPLPYRSIVSLKSRMSRFLPGSRSLPLSVPADSTVALPPRKKAVRFSTSGLNETDSVVE